MSFEGYVQRLCVNGHLSIVDVYNDDDGDVCFCGALFVYRHIVDETNDWNPEDRKEFEILIAAEYDICPTCENKKLVKPATYKIPEE